MRRILIIDDEPAVVSLIQSVAKKLPECQTVTGASAEEARKLLRANDVDVAVFDIMLPDASGLELMQTVREIDPRIPVIFVTGGGTAGTAIEAMKIGAFEYLAKPLNVAVLRDVLTRAVDVRRMMTEPVGVAHSTEELADTSGEALVGRSSAMTDVYKAIGRVAPKNVTVLIRGESGTGKELVARSIYQHSDRVDKPFLAVNCAAIPESLLESELFGHEKGAFTGAEQRRIGKFEQCSGGTIFLDEIGDMPLLLQSKILRLIQDQRFERVGGNETIETDVRIITATHRNLEAMSEAGEFRSDLYYRLNVYEITIPPLRDRVDDLSVLVGHFLRVAGRELEKDVIGVSEEAMEILSEHHWPGNVRELQSVLKKAVLNASGPVVLPNCLPGSLHSEPAAAAGTPVAATSTGWDSTLQVALNEGSTTLYDDTLERMELWLITAVLRHTGGNQVQAAATLGMTRTTLRGKISKLGISIEKVVE
jgi:two-component system nitrogen regulation response regulator GlnG